MHVLLWTLRVIAAGIFAFIPLVSLDESALAAGDTTITGIVRSGAGASVPGAVVFARGPVRARATTDGNGGFTLSVPQGVYQIMVLKPGYDPASAADVAVVTGQSIPLTITLSEQSLTTLRTIGSVTTNGRGASTINTGAANQSVVSGAEFAQLANPQVNDVLQRIPDIVVQKLGTQQDTSIVVGGLQPYETQVLIDGHPIALGQYGVWLSQYFPSYMVGNVETQSGPGNTTPFANIAVGGTVNLQTVGFTKKRTAEFNIGTDTYGSQYSNAVVTGSAGKLAYVASLGTAGANGHYFGKKECDTYVTDPATSTGVVAFCGDFSGSLSTKAQLYKLRYDFSPTTSFETGFLGSYGGFLPQGSAWGESLGPTKIVSCIANTQECTNPANADLIGKTINGLYWFPGTNIVNTQQLYSGQFRTSIASNTLLVRPYVGSIQPETYNGAGEGAFPAFFGPAPGQPGYPGPQSLPPGTPIPGAGLGAGANSFESSTCPAGTVTSFNQINSPANTITSANGQEECYQYPYSTLEIDKLYGSTFSFVHPIGGGSGFLNLTYDFHGQSTFAYANDISNVQVPVSATRYSTVAFTGSVKPIEKLAVDFGLYNTNWKVSGEQPTFDASGNPTGTTGLDRTVSRFDPHVALVYRADKDTSIRAATGTSETFPFVGDVSGAAAYQPPAFSYTAGIVTEKNANLQPEYSIAYELGADHRFRNGSLLSLDVQDTIVHDVFQQLTTQKTVQYQGAPAVEGIFTPINVARLEAKLVTLKYKYAPTFGLGYNLALTADSSVLSGIPASAYNASPSLPANDVQVCGNAQFTPGLATCIPYLKGYAQFTYAFPKGTYVGLGVDYEGKNNAYYQPPLAIADLTFRQPITKQLDLNMSVENLFNTNSYDYLPAPGLGSPAIANTSTDGTSIQQSSYSTYRIPAVTRTLHASVRAHVGR